MIKTGLFGGSFNPIHNGHISLALQLKEQAGLDEVWLMVSPQNPLKQSADLLDDEHRLRMARLAVEQVEGSRSMLEWTASEPTAVILGNEVKGVSQAAVDASDYCLERPQIGTKHSFNVACTAAMVMWQFYKNFKFPVLH